MLFDASEALDATPCHKFDPACYRLMDYSLVLFALKPLIAWCHAMEGG